MELLHRVVDRPGDPTVYIRILQPHQSLPDDSAVMGDEHPGSSDRVVEYGVSGESIPDHSGWNHSGEEGDKHPESNTVIQGKAIRSSRPDVCNVVARALDQLELS